MPNPELSLILPAKNEAAALGPLLARLRERFPEAELIVVDDGSTDGTAALAQAAGARVVRHPVSLGNGAAVKSGARAATGEVLVFLDADGQHDPDDIPRLLAKLDEGYDMAVGARDATSQASLGRGLANRLYNRLAGYVTGHRIPDLTSGFRAVRAAKFRRFLYLLPNGFSYPTTITMAFFRCGYPVAYVPIHAARRIGRSHLKPWKDGLRFLLIIFKIATLYSPLKLFAPLSALFFLAASLWYVHTFVSIGRFTNMSALLYTASLLIFLMGLVSEQITMLMYRDDAQSDSMGGDA
ncbi:glycosyltransferase family 2 protein [Tepidiphilus thermophilus]|uniref:Glycosyltransferase involved in cell wall bisynthesis n=1 Tax=Tepidiphilus thermophilus TaxID=876478 RepID=A0A0K6IXY9_9PROT|nr:glycosyltransferase family 2 protein [Tepidiphilus thermophilus]CUB07963.1 Glycosyltransferase involved in cell wall bisynthesis [Tepidiphilus thermophilus]